ncbi:MAG: hypothetical protein NTZ83_01965 [Candidatus Pacearchaeota archaeon]|nr:hypothetical protein [Candidatus Pacearchaeota archaeon]
MSLTDELTQKQVLKFQVNNFDKDFIDKTLSENTEGIFNLLYKMKRETRTNILNYLKDNYPNHKAEIAFTGTNYEIPFRKQENN